MQWTKLLPSMMNESFTIANSMMEMVNDDELNWKPTDGKNWMTVGQLLKHMTNSCGFCCNGFATGDWGMPNGSGDTEQEHADMLSPAEALPTVESVAEARELLGMDRKMAFSVIEQAEKNGWIQK